jgi:predicted RNase H-like nuclease (RuvC/YqgF family)
MNQELIQQNNELKNQVNNIPLLQQEIEKLKNYCNNSEIEKDKLKNEIVIYQEKLKNGEQINREMSEKINFLEQKLNSDPYYAREIMSKTLYDFALKMMSENN